MAVTVAPSCVCARPQVVDGECLKCGRVAVPVSFCWLNEGQFQNTEEEQMVETVEQIPQLDDSGIVNAPEVVKPKRIRKRRKVSPKAVVTPVAVADGSGKGKAQVKQGKPVRARTKAPSVSFTTQLGKDIADRLAVLNAESDQINSERVQLLQAQKALKS